MIAPYERTLNKMRAADRRKWSQQVADQLAKAVPNLSRVVFLAGLAYREFLAEHLTTRGVEVSVPMKGLAIGQQLSWLKKRRFRVCGGIFYCLIAMERWVMRYGPIRSR